MQTSLVAGGFARGTTSVYLLTLAREKVNT